jgi:hypothetical protein
MQVRVWADAIAGSSNRQPELEQGVSVVRRDLLR